MKRRVIITAAVLALILIFSGCSSGGNSSPSAASSSVPAVSGTASSVTSASPAASGRVFTLDELKQYNGQNGNPAYVAVNGIVYDVTNAKNWNNGSHQGHTAGTDLTDAIAQSPHGDSVLKGLPVVGTLQK